MGRDAYEREHARIVERRDGLAVSIFALGYAAVLLSIEVAFSFPLLAFVPVFAMMGGYLATRRWPRRREGRLEADERGVQVDGVLVRKRDRLRNGYLRRRPDGTLSVRVAYRFGWAPLDVTVDSEADGEALLAALRLGASHATATMVAFRGGMRAQLRRAAWLIGAMVLATSAFAWMTFHHLFSLGSVLYLVGMLPALILPLNSQVRVIVGADGVLVWRFVGKNTFIPYARIERAYVDGNDVVLAMTSAAPVRLGLGVKGLMRDEHKGDALARRIETARLAHARGGVAQPATLVARGERTARDWLDALKALANDARASYREGLLPHDQLWRMVEDVQSPADVRAGAAVALQTQLDGEGKARLEVAAATCASPRLRVVLDAVRQERDESEIEDALEALEPEARPRRANG